MTIIFNTIGILGFPRNKNYLFFLKKLYQWLKYQGYNVMLEYKTSCNLMLKNKISYSIYEIGKEADLAIIIGGDGNLLSAARILSFYKIYIIGINSGNLGFLTDIDPNIAIIELKKILSGQFYNEKRLLLEVKILKNNICLKLSNAINEIILYLDNITKMIEFKVYIDNIFAFKQKSNGIIISTPTGSTAYALSAGGPIITPIVNAISLVPMFPHTFSSRTLLINGNSKIKIIFSKKITNLKINCDSQIILPINNNEEIIILKSNHYMNLIHPNNYNYFNLLNKKLKW